MPSPKRPRHHPGPSPLQQVQFSTELPETIPSHGQVRDPAFWRRFSTALQHRSEEEGADADVEKGSGNGSVGSGSGRSGDEKYGDEWLAQQYKERRKCRILCAAITLAVILTVLTTFVVVYYFLKIRR